jgi:hypothetical protein
MCICIWREAPARPLPPRLCVVAISTTCCCIASIVSTDTLRVSNECMACLAVSCMTAKSWRPKGDNGRPYKPSQYCGRVALGTLTLAFSIVRTTSRMAQTDESCSSSIACRRGTCKENGSEDGSLGHMWDKVCWRRCWNARSTPMQSTTHL